MYRQPNVVHAADWIDDIIEQFADCACPPEVRRLGRTISAWRNEILAWHRAYLSNGPTEVINNSPRGSNESRSGFANFDTSESEQCSTPANQTGTYSPPSRHAEIRRAGMTAPTAG
jgi:transposase